MRDLKFYLSVAFAFAATLSRPPAGAWADLSDIVAPQSGNLTLGSNWSPIEAQSGKSFRWVDGNAQVLVHRPGKSYVTLTVELEAGPGLNTTQFPLIVRDASNRQVAGVFIKGHESVDLELPTSPNGDNRFALSVVGGGHRVPSDRRILNFRVFSLSDGTTKAAPGQGPSIAGSGVSIGDKGWYSIETFQGKTFRWVSNDASFTVNWPHDQDTKVRAIVEPGPGVGKPAFDLDLRDGSGKELGQQHLKGEGVANFDVHLHQGANPFVFHVDGGGKPAPHDKRTLNFRVFALSALQ